MDRLKLRSCKRPKARGGRILDVFDRRATQGRDANARFHDGSQPVRCSRPAFRVFALWAAFIWSAAVRAETAEPAAPSVARSNPETAFAEAVRIFKSGDTSRALPLFVHLGETTNSPNVQLYMGYCQLELGHEREAHQAFSQSAKLSRNLGGAKYVATQEAAQVELGKLNLRLASLTISFVELPAEFEVRLDGEIVDPSLLGTPLVVDPGLHQVDARAKGAKPIARDVPLEAGAFKAIALQFEKIIEQNVAQSQAAQPVLAPTNSASRWTRMGLVAAGLGAVGLGTFVVAGMQARSAYNKLQTECPSGCSDAAHRSDASKGSTYQTLANVGLGLGIAGTLTGATLVYLGVTGDKAATPSVEVSPESVKISYRGSF
jgi:hypothetical protein